MGETAAIILAAGKSTRLKSELPKVLHEVCGRPMLSYVLSACRLAGVDRIAVVVGHGKQKVKKRFSKETDITWVEQAKQNGTGHAVACCKAFFDGFDGSVLVVAGDMPLLRRVSLSDLLETRESSQDVLTLATTVLDDPTGYGRIVRDANGQLDGIVEHRDCTDEQRAIHEVNPSYYCFDSKHLFETLEKVKANRDTGEFYITDTVAVSREAGQPVSATVSVPAEDAMGINSRLDLATVSRVMQDRIQLGLMNEGVTIVDPDNTWVEADVTVGPDTTIYPFSFVGAGATIGKRCHIGPLAAIGSGQKIADGARIDQNSSAEAKSK